MCSLSDPPRLTRAARGNSLARRQLSGNTARIRSRIDATLMKVIAPKTTLAAVALAVSIPLAGGHAQEREVRRPSADVVLRRRARRHEARGRSVPADQQRRASPPRSCRSCGCTRRTTGATYRGGDAAADLSRLRAAARAVRLHRRGRRLPRRLRVVRAEPRLQPRRVARRRAHGRVRHHRVVREAAVEQRPDRHVGLLGDRRQPDAGGHDRAAVAQGDLPDERRVRRLQLPGERRRGAAAGRAAPRAAGTRGPRQGRRGRRRPGRRRAAAGGDRRARCRTSTPRRRAVPRQRVAARPARRGGCKSSPHTYLDAIKKSGIGVYAVANWDEAGTKHGAFFTFNTSRAARPSCSSARRTHCAWSQVKTDTGFDIVVEELRFFDYWLKGMQERRDGRAGGHLLHLQRAAGDRRGAARRRWPLPNEVRTTFYLGDGDADARQAGRRAGKDAVGVQSTRRDRRRPRPGPARPPARTRSSIRRRR